MLIWLVLQTCRRPSKQVKRKPRERRARRLSYFLSGSLECCYPSIALNKALNIIFAVDNAPAAFANTHKSDLPTRADITNAGWSDSEKFREFFFSQELNKGG